jgi:molybdate transport system substrate-binding protein
VKRPHGRQRSGGRRQRAILTTFAAVIALSWACDGRRSQDSSEDRSETPITELTVFAASSLIDAFSEIKRAFESANPDLQVTVSNAGSQVLRVQIEHGAPADVYASANAWHTSSLRESGVLSEVSVFARNALVLVVPTDNPADLRSLSDLPRAQRLVVGNPDVPIGAYTRRLLDRASQHFGPAFGRSVSERVVSLENNVRLVLAKVELGEADAAIVYRTDAASSDKVLTIELPEDLNVLAEYHHGVVTRSERRSAARRWNAFVLSPAGQAILVRHGFVAVAP